MRPSGELSIEDIRSDSHCLSSLMLMKPGPARLVSAISELAGRLETIASATARGFFGAPSMPFTLPNNGIALLHW